MNKFNTIVFAALTVLGSAQAMAAGQTHNVSFNNPALSSDSKLSRAEVQADYQRAVASGELHDLSVNRFTSSAERHAETKPARAEGKVARAAGAVQVRNISFNNPQLTADSRLTRAEVVAEFVRARDAGELDQVNFEYSPHKIGAM